jgi:hypothetical protein
LIILFSSITHEVRKLLLEGHTPVELAMMKSAELEKNIGATFARRLKNTLGEY